MPNDLICPVIAITDIRRQKDDWFAGRATVEDGPPFLKGRSIDIKGVIPGVRAGATFEMTLLLDRHPTYGDQYKVASYKPTVPRSRNALIRYLANTFDGVGMATATAIVDVFGDSAVDVLDAPDAVARIRAARAQHATIQRVLSHDEDVIDLVRQWQVEREKARVDLLLMDCGFSARIITAVKDAYGAELEDVLRTNPYRLMSVVRVTFKMADAVALNLGMPPSAPARLLAGAAAAMEQIARDGHTWADLQELMRDAVRLLDQPSYLVLQAITETPAELQETSPLLYDHAQRRVSLRRLWQAEEYVARDVERRQAAPSAMAASAVLIDYDRVFQAFQARRGFMLNAEQRTAVHLAFSEKVSVLTGGPGTGKSASMEAILLAAESVDIFRVEWAAPTGKAAKVLSRYIGRPARTVHRLILKLVSAAAADDDDAEPPPPPPQLVVVDESSMLDVQLAEMLCAAVPPGCHILFVGDVDQLPSVGPGRVLANLIESGRVPTVRLTAIHRQAAGSAIITTAHAMLKGEIPPLVNAPGTDLYFLEMPDAAQIVREVPRLVAEGIPRRYRDILRPKEDRDLLPSDIRVVVPQYGSKSAPEGADIGINAMNLALQERLNPAAPGLAERRQFNRVLRQGDLVIWTGDNSYEHEVMRGEELRILDFFEQWNSERQKQETIVHLDLDGEDRRIPLDDLAVDLAYAIGVHKSQGSQFPVVLMICHSQHAFMNYRELVYTAITRGQRLVIVVGEQSVFQRSARIVRGTERRTSLAERLCAGDGAAPLTLESAHESVA